MDDLKFGTRNKRGDWTPNGRIEVAPFWNWPPRLPKILAWLPGYIWPWNAFHMATALLYWFFVVPDVETMKTLSWGWALWLYAVNAAAIFVFYGIFELLYYVKRTQATRFKYNAKFPARSRPPTCSGSRARTSTISCARFFITIPLWTAGRSRSSSGALPMATCRGSAGPTIRSISPRWC